MKILFRSILCEYLQHLGFGLGLFCLALVGGDLFLGGGRILLESHSSDGLLVYALCRLPQACSFALPMACLLATLLTVGRMSTSNELIAIRCGGVSTARALTPLLAVGAMLSLGLMAVNLELVPRSVREANRIVEASLIATAPTGFSLAPQVLANGEEVVISGLSYLPEGPSISGLSMGIFFEGRRVREAYAEEASWMGDCWRLKGICVREFRAQESSWKAGMLVTRTLAGLSLPTPEDLARQQQSPDEMKWNDLVARARASQSTQARTLWLRLFQRLAIPWACLIFTVFSAPIAVVPHRSGVSAGFGRALALSGFYYLVALLAALLCNLRLIGPALAAWVPNLVFSLAAIYLWRSRRDSL